MEMLKLILALYLLLVVDSKNECDEKKLIACKDCRCCDANYCDLKEIPVPKDGQVKEDTKKYV